MIIIIAGTPGTGKTVLSRSLARKLKANLIHINNIVRKIPGKIDKKRNIKIVDVNELQKHVNKKVKKGINIIEGKPAHLLKGNMVIVLRCDPLVLRKRLRKKGWKAAKIKENVQAEMLDVVSIEAFQKHRRGVVEMNTTGKTVSSVSKLTVNLIERLIKTKKRIKFQPVGVNWTGKYGERIEKV